MSKKLLIIVSLAVLPFVLFAQNKLSEVPGEVLRTDSLGYQVVRLSGAALSQHLRDASVSFGSGSNCVLFNANGEEVFSAPFPPTEEYISSVTDMVVSNGGYPISNGRLRAIFKQFEIENKDFDLSQTVDEEDWDY